MLISRACPKCGSTNLAGPHKLAGQHTVKIDLPGLSTATLESITCTNCGYTELYSDRTGLENIKRDGRVLQNIPRSEPKICPFCGTLSRYDAIACSECGNDF